jgi:hypothetical protein
MKLCSALLAVACVLPVSATVTQARGAGDNVVTIDVTKVALPKNVPGECRVSGVVDQAWSGSAFRSGQLISIAVPCGARPHLIDGPAIASSSPALQDVEVLMKSKLGFAHLSDDGELIWQPSRQPYGLWGVVDGYRVLDGVSLPIGPA